MGTVAHYPGAYSTILIRAHEIRALISNGKYKAAARCAELSRESLQKLIDAEYASPSKPHLINPADPLELATRAVQAGECAHPISMEYELNALCSLLDRIEGDAQEAREDAVPVGAEFDVEANR